MSEEQLGTWNPVHWGCKGSGSWQGSIAIRLWTNGDESRAVSHSPCTQIRDTQLGRAKEKMSDCVPPKAAKPSPEGTIRLLLLAWPQGLLPGRSRGSVQLLQGQGSEHRLWALSRGNPQPWVPAPGSSGTQQPQQLRQQSRGGAGSLLQSDLSGVSARRAASSEPHQPRLGQGYRHPGLG